ncbi:cytochrome c [Catenovulum sp. 2E275]|uniref:c-type cytochrome n=1 Tax=Catenovulum sp. 2E275 TaxID=2980497 RepID=UPI0021D13EDE|nr:cytochrome c [Catenovulum sp. 2E275]MCU4676833.1 cytochrome c [Catenovulum sp. 2E275]
MKKALLVLSGLFVSTHLYAAPPQTALCATCHGQDGISPMPIYPNLKGQKEQYLYLQMQKFKDGSRPDPIMKGMVAALSDDDMKVLAKYYAELK